ncbi:MAG: carbohydrate ABC transporter permease [Clostridiales bacterium]|nr:carbohydrate ABC transporter permease [Clostridiales bacterium]
MKKKIRKNIFLIFLSLLAFFICFPVIFLLVGSLMGSDELGHYLGAVLGTSEGYASWALLPTWPTLKAYVELLLDSPEFFVMFWNSIRMTGLILIGQLLCGVPAAWGFAQLKIPFGKLLFNLYIILMLMPFQVTMLSNYLTLNALHLVNTQWAVILPAAFSTFPVFIMYHFFRSIPKEIMESAQLDGANKFQIFLHIGLPLGSSGIVSALVLSFLDAWNLIEQPMTFLKDKSLWPLSLYLPDISMENAGLAFVASVITLIPSLLVFLAGQNYLEQGIAASAVKE